MPFIVQNDSTISMKFNLSAHQSVLQYVSESFSSSFVLYHMLKFDLSQTFNAKTVVDAS